VTTYQKTVVLDNHRRDSLLSVLESVSYKRMGVCEVSHIKINLEIVKFASVYGQSMFSYWNSCSEFLTCFTGILAYYELGLPLKFVVLCLHG
jgi:hypothetical protein